MSEPIVKELELPPGPDGKAHQDFWMTGALDSNPGYPVWRCGSRASRRNEIMREWGNGEIYPHAARSIAWLWREAPNIRPIGTKEIQTRAWDYAAHGVEPYLRLPVVAFKEAKA